MNEYQVKIKNEYTNDDNITIDMGILPQNMMWYEMPLPKCPDCGGDLVWAEDGNVSGTRQCMGKPISYIDNHPSYSLTGGCQSLFSVRTKETEQGIYVYIRREKFY